MGKIKEVKIKPKGLEYQAIQVTGHPEQFGDLKRFAGDQITITYESCAIDDYWCIRLEDDLREKTVVIPDHDYILKFPDGRLTHLELEDFVELFEIPTEEEDVKADDI